MALVPKKEGMMRIDLTGAADAAGLGANLGAAARPAASAEGQSAAAAPEDKASISAKTLSIPSLTAQALASAEARAAKVEALRQAVAGATYNVDPALIADAMIGTGL